MFRTIVMLMALAYAWGPFILLASANPPPPTTIQEPPVVIPRAPITIERPPIVVQPPPIAVQEGEAAVSAPRAVVNVGQVPPVPAAAPMPPVSFQAPAYPYPPLSAVRQREIQYQAPVSYAVRYRSAPVVAYQTQSTYAAVVSAPVVVAEPPLLLAVPRPLLFPLLQPRLYAPHAHGVFSPFGSAAFGGLYGGRGLFGGVFSGGGRELFGGLGRGVGRR